MGDEHEGDADLALDRLELDLHLAAQLEVERTEWLVEQEDLGPVDERAGEGNPLTLAAGELVGRAVAVGVELDGGKCLLGTLRRRSLRGTFLTRSPYSTFSRTFMWGKSA